MFLSPTKEETRSIIFDHLLSFLLFVKKQKKSAFAMTSGISWMHSFSRASLVIPLMFSRHSLVPASVGQMLELETCAPQTVVDKLMRECPPDFKQNKSSLCIRKLSSALTATFALSPPL